MLASKHRFRTHLRPTDVFVVGHPKSGNTWLAYMLAVIKEAGDPDEQVNVANVGDVHPGRAPGRSAARHRLPPDPPVVRPPRGPAVFRNEEPVCPELYPRTVYLVRDPRSVITSYFHHYQAEFDDSEMSLDRFVAAYLDDPSTVVGPIARWDRQVAEWTDRSHVQPVMITRYEDLHEDAEGTLEEIATFCGIPAPRHAVGSARRRGGFEAMRKEEEEFGAEAEGFRLQERRGNFYRRGEIGGWRDELSPEAERRSRTELGAVMQELGYLGASPGNCRHDLAVATARWPLRAARKGRGSCSAVGQEVRQVRRVQRTHRTRPSCSGDHVGGTCGGPSRSVLCSASIEARRSTARTSRRSSRRTPPTSTVRCWRSAATATPASFGGPRVTGTHVLDIDPANRQATIIADLAEPDSLPAGRFHCFLLLQTLQFVSDAGIADRTRGGRWLQAGPCWCRSRP